jgi:cytoskeleton protein RodZ
MFGSTRREPERQDPADALVREVGAQLRQARLARGEQLEDVAEHLRIRPSYLLGLEEGDLSVIPGRAYALGFLRSYARYLGFDGEDLIVQIRSSVGDLTGKARLRERTPLSESGLPKLPILVVSFAALGGIYAGWAYLDDRDPAELDLVAEVPDDPQQQGAAPGEAAPAEITPAIAPRAEPRIEPEAGASDGPDAPGSLPSMSAPPPTAAPGSALESAAAPPPDLASPRPGLARDRMAGSAPIDVATATVEPGAGELPASSAPAGTVQPAPGAAPTAVVSPEQPASGEAAADLSIQRATEVLAALAPVAQGGATPTIYRTDAAAARVILRARSSAWVHVSSTNNDYLWVKTLQPGDAFLVPDRPDLVLWTGNAGGIEVIVDGAPLPPLGAEARVVRDVSLQPGALLRRLAPEPAADATSSQ